MGLMKLLLPWDGEWGGIKFVISSQNSGIVHHSTESRGQDPLGQGILEQGAL